MERIKYGKEPYMDKRYLVRTGKKRKSGWKWGYWERGTLKEVKELIKALKPGYIVEVFSITYNFREAWQT